MPPIMTQKPWVLHAATPELATAKPNKAPADTATEHE